VVTNLSITKESDMRISFRVVDFNIIVSADSMYANLFAVDLSTVLDPADTLVRMYYFLERYDSCLYKGHGDFRMN
jgi:hypothetical protein